MIDSPNEKSQVDPLSDLHDHTVENLERMSSKSIVLYRHKNKLKNNKIPFISTIQLQIQYSNTEAKTLQIFHLNNIA